MDTQRLIKCLALALALGFHGNAGAVFFDAYFGWNYIGIDGDPASPFAEAHLQSVTYEGASGINKFTLPTFPNFSGMPDGSGLVNAPTYTTIPGGDGETTRSFGGGIPIDWGATASGFPDILIGSFEFSIPSIGTMTADFGTSRVNWYHVGLIPLSLDTELCSNRVAPRGDIYDGLACFSGNPIRAATIRTGQLENRSIEVIFASAAVVPIPAAVWLFGASLIAFIGLSRRIRPA